MISLKRGAGLAICWSRVEDLLVRYCICARLFFWSLDCKGSACVFVRVRVSPGVCRHGSDEHVALGCKEEGK